MDKKVPGSRITVIIRDPSPFIFMQEPPKHRSVQIELTPEQMEALSLYKKGTIGGSPVFEEVSHCFIEEWRSE